jgi:hypothetical protein
MIGFDLDLKSPDFQTLMITNSGRIVAGKDDGWNEEIIS